MAGKSGTWNGTGRRLQAQRTTFLRAQGVALRPLTVAELTVWYTGVPMPEFAHICMDGETVVGAKVAEDA